MVSSFPILFLHLNHLFRLGSTTLDTLSSRSVKMSLWNPALIVSLLSQSTSCNSGSISTNDRNLIFRINSLLGTSRRTLSPFSTFSTSLCLWEEGLDPGLVYKVEGTAETTEEDKVEEDAGLISTSFLWRLECSHLRIKDTCSSINDSDSLVESLDLVDSSRLVRDHRNQVQSQVRWVQIGREREWQTSLLASWKLNIITCRGDILDDQGAGVCVLRQWVEGR
jgi:hypothetical protein